MDVTATEFVTEKVMNRFPDGTLEQVTVLGYGDDPAVEPGTQGIRVIINAGQFPAGTDNPLRAFDRAHEEELRQLRGDLGLLPPGSWIDFWASAEDVNRHRKRLRLGPKDSGMFRVPDKERPGDTTPVTARLGAAQLETLDTLITAGIAANRAEAVRWAIDCIRDRPACASLRERTRESKWLRGAGFPGSAAGQGPHRGRERRRGDGAGGRGWAQVPACCGRAPAAGLLCDGIPLCAVMSQFYIEAFRARIMIVASSGRYLAVSGHDHETARAESASLRSWH